MNIYLIVFNKIMKIILLLFTIHFSVPLAAEEYSSLYGFSLGEPIANVLEKLGEPEQVIDFENGSKGIIFIGDGHYVAFVTLPPKNDFIYSIQVTGKQSSGDQGIGGIQLGVTFKKVIELLGEPKFSRSATDQVTDKEVDGTNIHFYGENFSFEEINGVVSSIKLKYDETLSSDNPADEKLIAAQPELQKVRDHILNTDYPERFGDKSYRIAINGFEIIDFGNDGLKEAVVLYSPHYLQSPTIVIYQFQQDGAVHRIKEALAPGPLVKRGDYFLDSHGIGEGVDFTVGDESLASENGRKVAVMATEQSDFGLIVHYRNFFHADMRAGAPTYIDMTHLEPFSDSKQCAEFEFSKVDTIMVGYHKVNKDVGMIAATVGKQIYLYEISGINQEGFLDKKLTIMDVE